MTRREMLAGTGSTFARLSTAGVHAQSPLLKNMGGEPPGFGHRIARRQLRHPGTLPWPWARRRANEPSFARPRGDARQLRAKIDGYGMRVIISLAPPKDAGALAAYEAAVRAVSEIGAVTTHASFTARRYEEFDRSRRSGELRTAPALGRAGRTVLRRHKMKLAIENHKGWRAAEHVAWIKRLGSEWVGACYDFGNNISLCEDPAETLRLLAPVTIYVSFKDMAVAPYEEGFLLSEMALARGCSTSPAWSRCSSRRIRT